MAMSARKSSPRHAAGASLGATSRTTPGHACKLARADRPSAGDRTPDRQVGEAEPGEDGGKVGKDATRARRFTPERASGRDDRQFARLDRNGDGFIDAKEFETWAAERALRASQRFLERFDADGDGKVSRDEFRQFAKDRLANRDADGDDQITEAELAPTRPGRGILK